MYEVESVIDYPVIVVDEWLLQLLSHIVIFFCLLFLSTLQTKTNILSYDKIVLDNQS
jgi:hypothetical protein